VTSKRRRPSGGDSTPSRPSTPDSPTRRLGTGGGDALTVQLGALDGLTRRLNNTTGRVDAVSGKVSGVNVGPQSMGVLGANFTGAAQAHLRTAQSHVTKTRDAVEQARAGTDATAKSYRDNDETGRGIFERMNPGVQAPSVNRNSSATTPSSSTTPSAARSDPPSVGRDPSNPVDSPAQPRSIMDRLNPTPDPNAPYSPSRRERYLQQRSIVSHKEMGGPGNVNKTYEATLDDGSKVVYKPESGEATNNEQIRNSISGDLGKREMAASRVDDMLGFDRVPATTMIDGPEGRGSVQMYAEGAGESLPASAYPKVAQQQMAVLDYITGNTDRHSGNYLTGQDGSPIAIDHGFCFPDERGGRDVHGDPILSDFIAENINQPLDRSVMDAVSRVDPGELSRALSDSGLSDSAITHTLNRLDEIKRLGMITGEAHGRYLLNGTGALIYEDYYG
jgi:hypothetical protein